MKNGRFLVALPRRGFPATPADWQLLDQQYRLAFRVGDFLEANDEEIVFWMLELSSPGIKAQVWLCEPVNNFVGPLASEKLLPFFPTLRTLSYYKDIYINGRSISVQVGLGMNISDPERVARYIAVKLAEGRYQ